MCGPSFAASCGTLCLEVIEDLASGSSLSIPVWWPRGHISICPSHGISSKIADSEVGMREAQPFLKSPSSSFKMNLYKAHGIKPNLLSDFRILTGLVSLPSFFLFFFVSVCLVDGSGGGKD